MNDLAVISEEGVALRALTETTGGEVELLSNSAGEVSRGIGQEVDAVMRGHGISPGVHHVVVVDGDDVNIIDAVLLELLNVLNEGRHLQQNTNKTVECG